MFIKALKNLKILLLSSLPRDVIKWCTQRYRIWLREDRVSSLIHIAFFEIIIFRNSTNLLSYPVHHIYILFILSIFAI